MGDQLHPSRQSADLRCPYCHDNDFTTELSLRCPKCLAFQHAACYREHEKCGACGCSAGPAQDQKAHSLEDRVFVEELVRVTGKREGRIVVGDACNPGKTARLLVQKLAAGGAQIFYDRANEVVLWRYAK